MFWHLKNRIKEETGNDVDLIPSIVNSNQSKPSKDNHSHHGSTTSLGSFTIDGNKEDKLTTSYPEMKLLDGKVITPKEFKKLESKEEEWRKKLQKKDEELSVKLKKVEESWKKQLDEKEKEMKEELCKIEAEKKVLEEEKNDLTLKNAKLEDNSRKVIEYQKKICQYQEDIDQLQGFQTQEMAKIKHLLLVKEQELAEKDKLLKESTTQLKSLKLEISRLRNFEDQCGSIQDDLETLRHSFDLERAQLTSKLAEKEEDVRHLKDKVMLLEERANAGPIAEMTVDERVQKLLGERALFERRLEEAHLHLSQIKSTWSGKIESLETQVGRLCRQACEESSEKRQVELERDLLRARVNELETQLEDFNSKASLKNSKFEKLKIEKNALEEEIKKLRLKREEDVQNLDKEIETVTRGAFQLEEKLNVITKEANDKDEFIKSLESKLVDEANQKSLLEAKLEKLSKDLDTEKKAFSEIRIALEKERREKDEMMLRNAQISQEVELARQELRNQKLESNELHTKIFELGEQLKDQQKNLDYALNEKQELNSKLLKLEIIEKEQEVALKEENDLKAKVVQLENELFDKNKNVKILQQRLSDIKKTLQRELKVPATAIDPGGPDSDGYISYSSSASATSVLGSVPANQVNVSPRFRREETFDVANEDVNFKYLKHVLIKFLTSRECEAQHLTRAVATLLRFSAEEERLLKETLEWKMSWFGTKPDLGNGQTAKTIPPS